MNRNRKIWIAGFMLYLCTASMFAQIRGNEIRVVVSPDLWGIERSGFFNGREKWAKGFENQRV